MQTNYEAQNKILETIDSMIAIRLRDFKNTDYIQASLVKVNGDGTYNIRINDDIYENTQAITGTYDINDVVWILKINNEILHRKILCKV